MNFCGVRISSRGEREREGDERSYRRFRFLHVLIGFLLYGALNELPISDDV
jgi:hypothetical protein